MSVDYMDYLKTNRTYFTKRWEFQAGVILMNLRVITDLQLLGSMSKHPVALALTYIKRLSISWVDQSIDVIFKCEQFLLGTESSLVMNENALESLREVAPDEYTISDPAENHISKLKVYFFIKVHPPSGLALKTPPLLRINEFEVMGRPMISKLFR